MQHYFLIVKLSNIALLNRFAIVAAEFPDSVATTFVSFYVTNEYRSPSRAKRGSYFVGEHIGLQQAPYTFSLLIDRLALKRSSDWASSWDQH